MSIYKMERLVATTQIGCRKVVGIFAAVLLLLTATVFSGEVVEYLPGFNGKLPFKLETGYISVNESELFYYFLESEGDPTEDPLFLWLTGGPGCSSFNGIVYEVGPIEFNISHYKGGVPSLNYYPYAWTKTASILFLDSPIGTGFSYSTTEEGWATSDSKASNVVYHFFLKKSSLGPEATDLPPPATRPSSHRVPATRGGTDIGDSHSACPITTKQGFQATSMVPSTDKIDSPARLLGLFDGGFRDLEVNFAGLRFNFTELQVCGLASFPFWDDGIRMTETV